jgi:hypothetical protein
MKCQSKVDWCFFIKHVLLKNLLGVDCMKKYLTSAERTAILKGLTKKQKKTLFAAVGKRYRSYFADVLAKYKGTEDWVFYRYIDHGHVRKDVTCECGKPLRHQYILINKKTRKKLSLGSTHIIEELKIPESIAKEVLQGIHDINYDLDELLQKYHNDWELPEYIKINISKIKVPSEVKKLIDAGLPLLSRQLDLLYSKLSKLNSKDGCKKLIFTLKENDGFGGDFKYEIKDESIYNVLIGKTDFNSYIYPFRQDIEQFLAKKKRYIPVYEIINYLVGKGLPNELMYGQHALTNHFTQYLFQSKNIEGRRMGDGYIYFRV